MITFNFIITLLLLSITTLLATPGEINQEKRQVIAPPTTITSLASTVRPTTGTGTNTGRTTSISVPQTAAVGGLTITMPAQTAAISYYKIQPSNLVTFGWSFTGLYVTPASLTFQAHCSANGFTYPVGPATGIPGTATQLVWDPYAYQQSPNAINFAQASYTLRVFDERGYNAIATGGYFDGSNIALPFAMYTPAAYTPLAAGWTCIGCSSWARGMGSLLSHPLVVALPVVVSFVLIGGAGVFTM